MGSSDGPDPPARNPQWSRTRRRRERPSHLVAADPRRGAALRDRAGEPGGLGAGTSADDARLLRTPLRRAAPRTLSSPSSTGATGEDGAAAGDRDPQLRPPDGDCATRAPHRAGCRSDPPGHHQPTSAADRPRRRHPSPRRLPRSAHHAEHRQRDGQLRPGRRRHSDPNPPRPRAPDRGLVRQVRAGTSPAAPDGSPAVHLLLDRTGTVRGTSQRACNFPSHQQDRRDGRPRSRSGTGRSHRAPRGPFTPPTRPSHGRFSHTSRTRRWSRRDQPARPRPRRSGTGEGDPRRIRGTVGRHGLPCSPGAGRGRCCGTDGHHRSGGSLGRHHQRPVVAPGD